MGLEKILYGGKKILTAGLILSSLFFSCKKEDANKNNNASQNGVALSSNTKILTEQNLQEITYFDGNTIKFNPSSNSPILNENTFIVGGISDKTSDGILKRVSNVFDNGYSANLEEATLDDAIETGKINFSKYLNQGDLETSFLKNGVELKNSDLNYDFLYDINVIIYDLDGNLNTTNDQIRANGKIYLNANLGFNADFGKRTMDFSSNLETLVRIELEGELTNKNFDEEKLIAQHKFKPIAIFLPTTPPFPIVLRPIFDLYADASGEIEAHLNASVEETNNLSASINYDNGWRTTENFSKNFTFEQPQASLLANIKSSLGPKASLLFYGFIGPSLRVSPSLELNVNSQSNPWLILYGGIDGKIEINTSKIGMGIQNYEKEIFNFQTTLLELFNSGNTPPHAKFKIDPESGNIGTNFKFDASTSFDLEDPLSKLQFRWDWQDDGIWDTPYSYDEIIYYQYSSSGNYSVRLEVKDSQNATDQNWKMVLVGGGAGSTFNDSRDGQIYNIVKIGNQWWFAENLNYKNPNSVYYNHDSINYHNYGRLYNWNSAMSACPSGWHLPSDDDFKILEMYLGMSQIEANQIGPDRGASQLVGSKLKLGGSSGFNAEMTGHGYPSSFGITFTNFGDVAYFWTSKIEGSNPPFNRILYETNTGVSRDNYILENCYFSVRPVKDN